MKKMEHRLLGFFLDIPLHPFWETHAVGLKVQRLYPGAVTRHDIWATKVQSLYRGHRHRSPFKTSECIIEKPVMWRLTDKELTLQRHANEVSRMEKYGAETRCSYMKY
jgi:hypothetical protein